MFRRFALRIRKPNRCRNMGSASVSCSFVMVPCLGIYVSVLRFCGTFGAVVCLGVLERSECFEFFHRRNILLLKVTFPDVSIYSRNYSGPNFMGGIPVPFVQLILTADQQKLTTCSIRKNRTYRLAITSLFRLAEKRAGE